MMEEIAYKTIIDNYKVIYNTTVYASNDVSTYLFFNDIFPGTNIFTRNATKNIVDSAIDDLLREIQ